jgi:hypothetical protein
LCFLIFFLRFCSCFVCLFPLLCNLYIVSPSVYIAVSLLFLYKFTDHCHRVGTQLHSINIIYVVFFLLGDSPVSEFHVPTFRNQLLHLHCWCGQEK